MAKAEYHCFALLLHLAQCDSAVGGQDARDSSTGGAVEDDRHRWDGSARFIRFADRLEVASECDDLWMPFLPFRADMRFVRS